MSTQNAANIAAEVGTQIINQVGHGFGIGNVVYLNGATYTLAQADALATSRVVGIVIKSIDADNFILQTSGVVNLTGPLVAGTLYYLSTSVPGALAVAVDSDAANYKVPVLIAQTPTTGLLINQLPTPANNRSSLDENILHNSGYVVQSWGPGPFTSATVPANGDDTYLVDRWTYLSSAADTADVSVIAGSSPIYPQENTLQFDQETANQQWGMVQLIESPTAATFRNTPFTAVITASKNALNSKDNVIRFALIEWSGAINAMTSDVVAAAWASGGANPALAANWSYITTSGQITLTDNPSYYTISGTSGAAINNIALFIWQADADAAIGDFIYLGKSFVFATDMIDVPNSGTTVAAAGTVFSRKSEAQELRDCGRFFWSTYNNGVPPGTMTPTGALVKYVANSATLHGLDTPLPMMRATPAITWYAASNGAAGFVNQVGGAPVAIGGAGTTNTGMNYSGWPTLTGALGSTAVTAHLTADANL